jgi:hypothetical protein
MRIFLLTLLLPISLFSQDSKFVVGLQGGTGYSSLNYSFNFSGTQVSEVKGILGYAGGITLQYNFYKFLSLHTAFLHEKKGNRFLFNTPQESLLSNSIEYEVFSTENIYNIIPVLVRATFGKKIKYFGSVGTYFGFLQSQKQIEYLINSNSDLIIRTHSNFFHQTFDFGISSGFGIIYPLDERLNLSLEFRNNYGLTNLVKDNPNTSYTNSTLAMFGLSYKIGNKNVKE